MPNIHPLSGIYAAAVTPLKPDSTFDFESIPVLLNFLASRGCHGVLIFGTTGEGPSFSPSERESYLRAAAMAGRSIPGFRLLAGTGTPSLSETIDLTKLAFDLGFDGVVVLPPYYFRKASDDGLFNWFSELIHKAVPSDKYILGYHFPGVAGIGFSLDLLARLKDAFPDQFAGIKDSSHDESLALELGKRFGSDLTVFSGTDSHFHLALQNGASGAITAPANILSPGLREIWDLYCAGQDPSAAQTRVTEQRHVLENYMPFPPSLKALMNRLFDLPRWAVKPPLEEIGEDKEIRAAKELEAVN
ncbi:MAG: dihydrodipicolinate synthase family protein [Chloroflexota bacterium]